MPAVPSEKRSWWANKTCGEQLRWVEKLFCFPVGGRGAVVKIVPRGRKFPARNFRILTFCRARKFPAAFPEIYTYPKVHRVDAGVMAGVDAKRVGQAAGALPRHGAPPASAPPCAGGRSRSSAACPPRSRAGWRRTLLDVPILLGTLETYCKIAKHDFCWNDDCYEIYSLKLVWNDDYSVSVSSPSDRFTICVFLKIYYTKNKWTTTGTVSSQKETFLPKRNVYPKISLCVAKPP